MSHLAGVLTGKHFSQKDVPSLVGRTYIVTGGSNGIGLSAARCLYAHGAEVTITASKKETADAAIEYIRTGNLDAAPKEAYADGFHGILGEWKDASAEGGKESGEVAAEVCDFKDLKAVAALSKKLAGRLDRLDGLLLNAGIGVNEFALTADGYDSHLTINCLSHMVMVSHLLPVLEKTSTQHPDADVRIVLQSSELHRATMGSPSEDQGGNKFRSTDVFKKDIGQLNLYGRTKLGMILITKKLVQQYLQPGSKILVHATHPGGVATGQTRQYPDAYGDKVGGAVEAAVRPIMRSPDQGALSLLWAAVAPEARDNKYKNGSYFDDAGHLGSESKESNDPELIDNFWKTGFEVIEKVVGPDNVGPFHA
ncbi:hypothetical protein JCM8202_002211 [Rhodotorula sphaerocarpa]